MEFYILLLGVAIFAGLAGVFPGIALLLYVDKQHPVFIAEMLTREAANA